MCSVIQSQTNMVPKNLQELVIIARQDNLENLMYSTVELI